MDGLKSLLAQLRTDQRLRDTVQPGLACPTVSWPPAAISLRISPIRNSTLPFATETNVSPQRLSTVNTFCCFRVLGRAEVVPVSTLPSIPSTVETLTLPSPSNIAMLASAWGVFVTLYRSLIVVDGSASTRPRLPTLRNRRTDRQSVSD